MSTTQAAKEITIKTIKLNESPLVFWGDNHGDWRSLVQFIEDSKPKNRKKNVIQVGDMGMGMRSYELQKILLDELNIFLQKHKSILYAIRGNHDDPNFFNGFYKLGYSNIIFIEDYTVLKHSKATVLCIGGALSIDRSKRKTDNILLSNMQKDYRSWFKNEKFIYDEPKIDYIHKNFDIDIIVTHSAPESFEPVGINDFVRSWAREDDKARTLQERTQGVDLLLELAHERKLHEKLLLKFLFTKCPKYWFYGHFHFSDVSTHGSSKELESHLLGINEFYELNL